MSNWILIAALIIMIGTGTYYQVKSSKANIKVKEIELKNAVLKNKYLDEVFKQLKESGS